MVVMKRTINPNKNNKSAARSSFFEAILMFLIAKKDNKQLAIKTIIAKAAPSSINDDSLRFEILTEVNTMKQNPIKFAEVFKM